MLQRIWIWMGTAAFALAAIGCNDVELNPPGSPANPLDSEESALITELDALRAASGVTTPLIVCPVLNVSASAHSDDQRDNDYLDDTGLDGSTPRSRACEAGYPPGCSEGLAMAELVASGIVEGKKTLQQWSDDEKTRGLLLDSTLIVVGVGRAIQGKAPIWTLDLASKDDPACD